MSKEPMSDELRWIKKQQKLATTASEKRLLKTMEKSEIAYQKQLKKFLADYPKVVKEASRRLKKLYPRK